MELNRKLNGESELEFLYLINSESKLEMVDWNQNWNYGSYSESELNRIINIIKNHTYLVDRYRKWNRNIGIDGRESESESNWNRLFGIGMIIDRSKLEC